jgi:SAM-dependent methyltransferase
MNETIPWHEDDAFWREMAPVMFTGERWRDAEKEVREAMKLAGAAEGAPVLDLGCGPGRHALALAKLGYRVVGVDRTRAYLDEAQAKGDERQLTVEWVCADMRDFQRPEAFDAAICMLTSFGFFEDAEEDRRVLTNLQSSLKPCGAVVLDLMGKEVLARIFRPTDWHTLADGSMFLEERAVENDWSRLNVRWILIKGAQRYEHRFALRLYAAGEIKTLLADAGFVEVQAFGSLDGAAYGADAQRLVLVARKAGAP